MTLDRRTFALGLTFLPLAGALAASSAKSSLTSHSPERAAYWMRQWMASTKAVDGPLWVSRFKDPIYFLLKPIKWQPGHDEPASYPAITVPVGFVTDFASIPQIFWSILKPDGDYAYAAVLHDYLYWVQNTSREVADDIFRLAMIEFDVGSKEIFSIYSAVRLFGSGAWAGNANLKIHGERRILKKFPDDPRVTWEEWKKKEGIFQ